MLHIYTKYIYVCISLYRVTYIASIYLDIHIHLFIYVYIHIYAPFKDMHGDSPIVYLCYTYRMYS